MGRRDKGGFGDASWDTEALHAGGKEGIELLFGHGEDSPTINGV